MDWILTCSDNLGSADLAPFLRSARRYAPQARVVLFDTGQGSMLELCRETGAEVQAFSSLFPEGNWRTRLVRAGLWRAAKLVYRLLRYPVFKNRLLWGAGELLLRRNQARFFAYRRFFECALLPQDRALLCDSRDLVFQHDPFVHFPAQGAFLTAEESQVTLSQNVYNWRWYCETYGPGAARRHRDKPLVCAGLIGGSCGALKPLLDAIIAESRLRPIAYGADQAILNHLVFQSRHGCDVLPNRRSICWHLYGVPDDELCIRPDGLITDRSGFTPAVIHMYDRCPAVLAAVRRTWSSQ